MFYVSICSMYVLCVYLETSTGKMIPLLTSLLFSSLCHRLGHADIFNLIKKHKLYEESLRHLMELLQLDEMVGAHICT